MTVEEVKDLRMKLAADITELIAQFQKQSGCTVERVSIQHLVTDARKEPIRSVVDVEIKLP
jgi:hypothetical protein